MQCYIQPSKEAGDRLFDHSVDEKVYKAILASGHFKEATYAVYYYDNTKFTVKVGQDRDYLYTATFIDSIERSTIVTPMPIVDLPMEYRTEQTVQLDLSLFQARFQYDYEYIETVHTRDNIRLSAIAVSNEPVSFSFKIYGQDPKALVEQLRGILISNAKILEDQNGDGGLIEESVGL